MHPLAEKIVAHDLFAKFSFHPLAGQIVDGCQYLWDGSKLVVPWSSVEVMEIVKDVKGLPEPIETDRFVKLIQSLSGGEIILYELGAGGGIYSLYAAKISPAMKLLLVEPNDFLYEVTKKNIVLNGLYERATIIHAAISERAGEMVRISDDMHSSCIGAADGYAVVTVTVDALVQSLGDNRVDVLHMDVQGAEMKALKGCIASFGAGIIKNIFISTHSDELHTQCIEVLQEQNFRIDYSRSTSEAEAGYDGLIVANLISRPSRRLGPLSWLPSKMSSGNSRKTTRDK